MNRNHLIKFVVSIAGPVSIGFAGSIFSRESVSTWYDTLEKPALNPPPGVFGPVWTVLYILMGIAFFIVWIKPAKQYDKRNAYAFYFLQLLFNFLWSYLFFGQQSPGRALADIMMLLLLVVGTMLMFRKVSKPAALLLIPYLLWVAFAAYLNFEIWRLN